MSYPHPWMSRTQKLLVLLMLAGGLGLVAACGGGRPLQTVPSQFAPYPRSEALDQVIKEHINAGSETAERRILLTTWFQDGDPRVAQFCSVREDGECRRWQYVNHVETSLRASPSRMIPDETLAAIQKAASELPPSGSPSLENMLIVSYRQNGVWETRLYDRMKRPAPVSTIFEMTNAPVVP